MVVQSVPSLSTPWVGEFVLWYTYDNEPFEQENEDGQIEMHDSGQQYSFFYGDTNPNADPELAAYIVESFKIVE